MFKYIDPELWIEHAKNPVTFLENVSISRLQELENDKYFNNLYDSVCKEFYEYIAKKKEKKATKIAYFSMEYGFDDNLKIFSEV